MDTNCAHYAFQHLVFDFQYVDLQQTQDYLKVYDGKTRSAKLLAHFQGHVANPAKLAANRTYALIELRTTKFYQQSHDGFVAHYYVSRNGYAGKYSHKLHS